MDSKLIRFGIRNEFQNCYVLISEMISGIRSEMDSDLYWNRQCVQHCIRNAVSIIPDINAEVVNGRKRNGISNWLRIESELDPDLDQGMYKFLIRNAFTF